MVFEVFDYVQTQEAVFILTASYAPEGTVLGFPIYIRDENHGDRRINGWRYRKRNDNKEKYPSFPGVHRRVDLGEGVFQVPLDRVIRAYKHREFKPGSDHQRFLDKLSKIVLKSTSMIGSSLVGSERPHSDRDVLIYGSRSYGVVKSRWQEILESFDAIGTDERRIRKKAKSYAGRFPVNEETLFRVFGRRDLKFYRAGKEISVIPTFAADEVPPRHPLRLEEVEEVKLEDQITDDSSAFMMPRMYQCETHRVWSFRWMDRGFAFNGETVEIRGIKISDEDVLLRSDDHYIIPVNLKN